MPLLISNLLFLYLDDALKLTVDLIFPHNDVKFDLNSNWDRLRKWLYKFLFSLKIIKNLYNE